MVIWTRYFQTTPGGILPFSTAWAIWFQPSPNGATNLQAGKTECNSNHFTTLLPEAAYTTSYRYAQSESLFVDEPTGSKRAPEAQQFIRGNIARSSVMGP